MILRVYCGNKIKEIELDTQKSVTIGSNVADTVCFDASFLKKGHVKIHMHKTKWLFKSATAVTVDSSVLTQGELILGHALIIDRNSKIAIMCYQRDLNTSRVIEFESGFKAAIGRSSDCEIQIGDKTVSAKHLEITKSSKGYYFKNLSKSGGTYLNGTLTNEAHIKTGDTLDIGFSKIVFSEKAISIISVSSVKSNIANVTSPQIKTTENADDEYPHLFKQSPRMIETVKPQTIDFQNAPNIGGKPKINWVSVLLPSISSVVIMSLVVFFLGSAMTMLYFSAPMALIGVFMAIYNYKSQCKEYKKTEQLRMVRYEQYLNEQEEQIKDYLHEQFRVLTNIHPSTAECVNIVAEPARRLWERRSYDNDFMHLRIGSGKIDGCIEYNIPKKQLSLQDDALDNKAETLSEQYKKVDNCPVLYDANTYKTCGITGPRDMAIRLAKNMVLQACTHHSYDDVKIVTVFHEDELAEWEFVKWLPHSFDEIRSKRYIVNNPFSAKKILTEIEEELLNNSGKANPTFYLFVIAESTLINNHSIYNLLVSKSSNLPVGTLLLYNQLNHLPKECEMVIEMENGQGIIYNSFDAEVKTKFTIDTINDENYELFARAIAPIRVSQKQGVNTLPTVVTFLEAYGVNRTKELELQHRWGKIHPENTMAVPIGTRANGEAFLFDIHEKQYGPHGLVAGTTGSGKSEMVQTWVLSMALQFPPEEVSFVLIDFKGTGLILPFKTLPHIAGTISDLDVNITRNLLALENELSRRKLLFDKYGVSNISGYLKLYRQGKVDEPLSYMFIVIDEFAEFKIQFPEFMTAVNSVFATGRTLGVHVVLLTQKPANVVDDKMNANTRFRWCLKVASSADSKDMLHHPDAAMIKNPGRAFVQVGEDEVFEEIQSYYSGAPYVPFKTQSSQYSDKIYHIDIYGNKNLLEAEKTTGYRSEENEIDAVVNYIDNYTRTNDMRRARNVWTNKLSENIELSEILQIAFDGEHWSERKERFSPVIGMVDNPKIQSQYPLQLDFLQNGHTAVYGSPSAGKTTFLHTTIMSTMLSYRPSDVNIYAFDFGGGSLNLFKDFPHVGCIAKDTETEKVEKLFKLLFKELTERKEKISSSGLINLESYREMTGEKIPYILMIVDNFAPISSLYPQSDEFFQTMSSQGGAYGMFFVITGGAQNAISYRVSQNIKNTIALQMTDKNDYSAIVGRTNGLEPENNPGRGLIKAKEPLEFQTALPASGNESARITNILNMAKLMNQKWDGPLAPNIPIIPDVINSSDYVNENIFVGLDTEKAKPIYLSDDTYLLLISCADKNTGISLLDKLVHQFYSRKNHAQIAYVGKSSNLADNNAMTYLDTIEQFDKYLEELMPILQQRLERYQSNDQKCFDPILIAINDYEWCFSEMTDESLKRLTNIIRLGQGLGVYVFISDIPSDIASKSHSGDGVILGFIGGGVKVLMGSTVRSHDVLVNDLSSQQKEIHLSDKIGFVIINNEGEKVKLIDK